MTPISEAAIGMLAATVTAPSGIGLAGGGLLMAHGLDNFQAGCYQAFNGQRKDPATVQLLQAAGLSPGNASLANDALMIFGSTAGTAAMRFGQAAYAAMPPRASTKFMPRENIAIPKQNSGHKISQLEEKISEWLGSETKMIKNRAGDPIFISKDGTRRIRFDFNNPHGDVPHMYMENKINTKWKDATHQHRIYPTSE